MQLGLLKPFQSFPYFVTIQQCEMASVIILCTFDIHKVLNIPSANKITVH